MAAATKVAQNPALIARLQVQASRNPRLYRLHLTLVAIGGDFALMATQIAPIAVPVVIGALWMNAVVFYWLSGAGILLLAWLSRPTFRFSGRELTPEEAPELHREISALKRKLAAPGRMKVYVDGSFNASAAETRGWFGILGTRSALTLGVPLLQALDREQALAVIAHEFGHFSRRHGRLNGWLYRARQGWMAYAEEITDSDSTFDQAAAWYARQFVPYFNARSFVHSRQCEYEADADAAFAVGARPVAMALARIAVIARLWEKRLPREIAAWQERSAQPPGDFYERFRSLCLASSPRDLQALLDEELREPSGWLDTHPSLSERLASLKEPAALAPAADCAGERLLGAAWPGLLAEFNATWTNERRPDWYVAHLRLKHIDGPLLAAEATQVAGWTAERQLARAAALRVTDAPAGMAALRELHERYPGHPRVTFAYAAALLDENDEETGPGLMEVLAREHPAFRVPAFRRGAAYFERRGNSWQAERWSSWLKRAEQSLVEALVDCMRRIDAPEKAQPSTLPEAERALIAAAAGSDPCLKGHWLIQGTADFRYAEGRPAIPLVVHFLALSIDPGEMSRQQQDEEMIRARYKGLLSMLLPPDEVPVVRTYFTTEELPAIYR